MRFLTRQFVTMVAVFVLLIVGVAARGQVDPQADKAVAEPMRLELAWKLGHEGHGVFEGVDVDLATSEVYAACGAYGVPSEGTCYISVVRLDRSGKEMACIRGGPFREQASGDFRLANLDGKGGPQFVVAGVWSKAVHAFDAEGKTRWSYVQPHGVDSIWAADLDGDKRDEVIIGYNAKGGVQVLNPDGTLRWKSSVVGNVWSITAAPTGPEGAMQVLAPGRGFEQLQAFTADGKPLAPLILGKAKGGFLGATSGLDPYWVRIGRAEAEPLVLVSDGEGKTFECLDRHGKVSWRRDFAGGNARDVMASPDRPWFAVALGQKRVAVHDVRTGERLVSVDVPNARKLAWVPALGDEPPLLIVEAFNSLQAYTVRGSAATPKPAPPDYAALGLPAPDPARGQPVAWFRGRYVYFGDLQGTDLQALIAQPLVQEFAKEQKIEPTEEQIRSFRQWVAQQRPKEGGGILDGLAETSIARSSVEQWLLGKALYERFGGEVIFQQGNPMEPVGGMRKFLEEHEARGSFKILDAEHKSLFWDYYLRKHSMEVPKERIDFSRPWWEQEAQR